MLYNSVNGEWLNIQKNNGHTIGNDRTLTYILHSNQPRKWNNNFCSNWPYLSVVSQRLPLFLLPTQYWPEKAKYVLQANLLKGPLLVNPTELSQANKIQSEHNWNLPFFFSIISPFSCLPLCLNQMQVIIADFIISVDFVYFKILEKLTQTCKNSISYFII